MEFHPYIEIQGGWYGDVDESCYEVSDNCYEIPDSLSCFEIRESCYEIPADSWYDYGSVLDVGPPSMDQCPPTLYYALPPCAPQPPREKMHRFGFKYDKTILQSIVFGPSNRPYFRVAHDQPRLGSTLFTNTDGFNFAVVDWQHCSPMVELKNVMDKQRIGKWMPLTSCGTRRTMTAMGKQFTWVPDLHSIALYSFTTTTPTLLAKIWRSSKLKAVILQVSNQAMQQGLLEHLVVSTVLLQSGRNID